MYPVLKRGLDVLLAATGLLALSPAWIAILVAMKVGDRGPVLYPAPRVGRHGEIFTMYKFRTMVVDADRLGGPSTADDDPRITAFGQFLRRHKLDEIPQLVNVLRGEMSIVGPRPQVASDVARYSEAERRLLDVRPGITDWASIRFRDEGSILAGHADPDLAYDELIRPEKIRLGLDYVDRVSFMTDARILLATARAVMPERAPAWSKSFDYAVITETATMAADDAQFDRAAERFSLVAQLATRKRCLEVAAGTGYGLPISASGSDLTVAGDLSARNLSAARESAPWVPLVRFDACRSPFRAGTFDVVACLEAIYYFDDLPLFLAEAARLLTTGGELVVSWPNPARPSFSPSPGGTWYPHPHEIRSLLGEAGFRDIRVIGSTVNASEGGAGHVLHHALVKTGLMPRTLRGRARLKRLMLRRVRPLGAVRLTDLELQELRTDDSGSEHAILFAIARAT